MLNVAQWQFMRYFKYHYEHILFDTYLYFGSRLLCLIVNLSLSHWYPGSGVELNLLIPDLCPLSYFNFTKLLNFA